MNKNEFAKWVDKTVKAYNADCKVKDFNLQAQGEIIEITLVDEDTAKTGMSICDVEQFDYETSIAIAYANLRGLEVPEVEEEPKFERAEKGGDYYRVDFSSRGVFFSCLEEEDCEIDKRYFNFNNYFRSRERAEEVTNKINALLKLERLRDVFCPHYKPVWNGYERNYYVRYCVDRDKWTVRYDVDYCSDVEVYFPTEMIALQVCDILNKDC